MSEELKAGGEQRKRTLLTFYADGSFTMADGVTVGQCLDIARAIERMVLETPLTMQPAMGAGDGD